MSYHHWQLENGLTVAGERHVHMKSVSVGFFVKTGSRDEPSNINGVSHFLEHMLFKGGDKLSGEEVDAIFDHLGAEYNAFTGFEYTGYYARVLPEHLEALFELLAELLRPALREEDFNVEKKVILEEIALYEDRPSAVLQRNAIRAYYGDHPLGQDILGSSASVEALTPEQMRTYYEQRYVPRNLTLSVVGNFDADQVQSLAQTHCAGFQAQAAAREYPEFSPKAQQVDLVRENVSRQHWVMLSPAPAFQDDRSEAMDLLVDVLGHPGNSRLHWALVDKGLVDHASASCHAQDRSGVLGISLSCDPKQVQAAADIVDDEIRTLLEKGITQSELDSARNRVLTSLAVEGEQSLRRLFSFAFDFLYDSPYRNLETILETFEKVTVDDIHQLLEEFPFSPRTVTSLGALKAN